MLWLKQSTAVTVKVGPFLDETDGDTEETGLTISQADIRLSKNGGAFAQSNNVAGATHDENGHYGVPLDTTDTNTLGTLKLAVHETGALPVWNEYMVVPANIWDSFFGADYQQVDLLQIGGDTQSGTDLKDFADAGYDPATNKVQGVVLVDTTTTNTDLVTAAAVRTEMDNNSTELAKIGTIPALDGGGQTIGAAIAKLADDNAGADFDATTDSLQAIRDRGDSAWTTGGGGSDRLLMVDTTIATLATQVSCTLTAGSTDDDAYNNCTIVIEDASTSAQKAVGLISDYTGASKTVTLKYDPGIFTMQATDKVYILAENALKSTAQNRQLDVTATGAAGIDWGNIENPTTAVDLSSTDIQLCDTTTAVTNEVTADAVKISGDSTAADNAELFFDGTGYDAANSTIGTTTTVTNEVTADCTKISGDTAAANNAELFFDGTGYNASNSTVGTCTTVTNEVTADMTKISGDATAANNAELFFDDTGFDASNSTIGTCTTNTDLGTANTELASVPTTTSSMRQMVQYLFEYFRNKKTVTATTETLLKEDASTSLGTATLSDDGTTFTKGEMS